MKFVLIWIHAYTICFYAKYLHTLLADEVNEPNEPWASLRTAYIVSRLCRLAQ